MNIVDTKSWQGGTTTITEMPPLIQINANTMSPPIPPHVMSIGSGSNSSSSSSSSSSTSSTSSKKNIGGRRPNKENGVCISRTYLERIVKSIQKSYFEPLFLRTIFTPMFLIIFLERVFAFFFIRLLIIFFPTFFSNFWKDFRFTLINTIDPCNYKFRFKLFLRIQCMWRRVIGGIDYVVQTNFPG